MQLGTTDKWYVDQTQIGYEALAFALKAQYPQLRVAIGPASLNAQYIGTNPPKGQIESFIAGFVPSPLHPGNPPGLVRKAPSAMPPTPAPPTYAATAAPSHETAPSPAAVPKRGGKVWVLIPGIGPVEALFVASLPDGLVLIDLDGVQTPVEQAAVHADLLAAEAAAAAPTVEPLEAPTAEPEPPKASAVAPEPPKTSSAVPEPPEGSTAVEAPAAVPESPEAPGADPGSAGSS